MGESRVIRAGKRLVVPLVAVAALVIALAAPELAGATNPVYRGPVAGGQSNNAGVEFNVKFRHGHPKKILNLGFFNVRTVCGSPAAISGDYQGDNPKVTKNSAGKYVFHAKGPDDFGRTLKMKGTFKHNFKKVVGTFRDYAGNGCPSTDTGTQGYVAHKGG